MKKKGIAYTVLGLAVLILTVCNILWLDHWIDSDMAAEMIFSDLLADTGHLIATPEWYYSTEFRILYTQLAMVPLFHVMGSWHVIRVITNLCFYGVLFASYLFMIRPLKMKRETEILSAALLFFPFSEAVAQHVHYGNTYISHIILMFLTVGCVLRLAVKEKQAGKKTFFTVLILMILSFLCGASGVRYLMSVFAPLLLTGFIMMIRSGSAKSLLAETLEEGPASLGDGLSRIRKASSGFGGKVLFWSVAATVPALAGYLFNTTYLRSHYLFTTYENTNFVRIYKGMFYERICDLFGCFLELFGYIPDKGVLSLRGLITLLSFVLIGCLFFVWKKDMVLSEEKEDRDPARLFPVLSAASFLIMVFFLLFTNTTLTARYFILPVFYLPVLTAIFLEKEKAWAVKALYLAILFLALTLSTLKIDYSLKQNDKNAAKRVVADYLVENGYEFGFALYDEANLLRELSDGKLSVATVTDTEHFTFFRWSSAAAYYDRSYHAGKVFFVAAEWEMDPETDQRFWEQAKEEFRYGGLIVYSLENGDLFYDAQNME